MSSWILVLGAVYFRNTLNESEEIQAHMQIHFFLLNDHENPEKSKIVSDRSICNAEGMFLAGLLPQKEKVLD